MKQARTQAQTRNLQAWPGSLIQSAARRQSLSGSLMAEEAYSDALCARCCARRNIPTRQRQTAQGLISDHKEDHENERNQCKNDYFDPQLNHAATPTISRYQIASEQQ